MGGSHDVAVREADWDSVGHGQFVGAQRGGSQKRTIAPRVSDSSVVVGGAVGGN